MSERTKPLRAPVQGDYLRREPPGSIDWEVHLKAFEVYVRCYGRCQSAETLAARGGFGQGELRCLVGRYVILPRYWPDPRPLMLAHPQLPLPTA